MAPTFIVFEDESPQFNSWKPSLEDKALGWFHDTDWNRPLQELEAEWIIFTHPSVTIDRYFLNTLAEVNDGFPMVDALAPRIKFQGHFYGGILLNGSKGYIPLSEEATLRYVAAPHPLLGVFSRRIIQRTGLFDMDLPPEFRLLDYSLRMAHAGGKMFNVPYLTTTANQEWLKENADNMAPILTEKFLSHKQSISPLWEIFYKDRNATDLLGYTLRHISTWSRFAGLDKEHKARDTKRDKATSLSKLTTEYQKEISL